MKVAILQSRASHPSCDAAACCAFMAFFVAQAETAETVDDGRPKGKGKGETWEKWGKWKNLEKPWEYVVSFSPCLWDFMIWWWFINNIWFHNKNHGFRENDVFMMGSWGSIPRFGAMLTGENYDFSGQCLFFCKSLGYWQWTQLNGW